MKFLLIFLFFFTFFGCATTMESDRDPSKQGYFLAEKMIKDGRYYDGLLLHRINTKFFSDYSYGQKSLKRIFELNKDLQDSVKGRPKVEIIKTEIMANSRKARISIANNTDKQINDLILIINFYDQKEIRLINTISREQEMTKRIGHIIGPWALHYSIISLDGYDSAAKIKVSVKSFAQRDIPLK